MTLDVYFTPAELTGAELPGHVVVLDVLRATSSAVEALTNGARAIFPVATADDAVRIAQNIGRDTTLLCGERKALPIEGFDLGNSPSEFTADRLEGRALVMTTTNGTRALLAVAERQGAQDKVGETLIGAFLNLSAVARRLSGAPAAAIVCAGREQRFGLDDAACAGALIRALEEAGAEPVLNDAGRAARSLAATWDSPLAALEASAAGRSLRSLGLQDDVEFCARVDRASVVPLLRERKITVEQDVG